MEKVQTTDVINVAEAISNYGSLAVILAVFLILFIGIVVFIIKSNIINQKKLLQENEKNSAVLQSQQRELIGSIVSQQKELMGVVINHITNSKPKYEETNIVEIFIKLNDSLKGECKTAQLATGASRIAVYVFHNGSTSSHGFPFFKMSCVCEFLQRGSGLAGEIQNHTNLPLDMFSGLVKALYDTGDMSITDTDELKKKDPITFAFLSSLRIQTGVLLSIYDEDNRILGFIDAEFTNKLNPDELSSAKRNLIETCLKISPVLQFSEYQNKK